MNKQIASLVSGIRLAGFIALAIAVPSDRASELVAVRTLSGEVLPSTRAIRVENKFGPVTVQAVDQGFGWDWHLQGAADAGARNEDFARDCSLEVRQTEGGLEITLITPDRQAETTFAASAIRRFLLWALRGGRTKGTTLKSDLQLRVPRSVTLDLKNRFGGV